MDILDGFTLSFIFKIFIFWQFLICTTHSTNMDFQRGGIHFTRKWFIIGMLEWVFYRWNLKLKIRTGIIYVKDG